MLPLCDIPGRDSQRPWVQVPLLHAHAAQEQHGLFIMNEKMLPQDCTTCPLLQYNWEKQEVLWVKRALCTLLAQGLRVAQRAQRQIRSQLQPQIPSLPASGLPILGFNFLGG